MKLEFCEPQLSVYELGHHLVDLVGVHWGHQSATVLRCTGAGAATCSGALGSSQRIQLGLFGEKSNGKMT